MQLTDKTNKIRLFSLLLLSSILVTTYALDQISKVQAERQMLLDSAETEVKNYKSRSLPLWRAGLNNMDETGIYLGITYVRNQGSAWGALQDLNPKIRDPFFYLITLFAVIVIFNFLRQTPYGHRVGRYALILVLSGALGNFTDRVRLSYVIDWIDVKWNMFGWYYDFPVFNIADSCISVGITMLLIDMIFLEKIRSNKLKNRLS